MMTQEITERANGPRNEQEPLDEDHSMISTDLETDYRNVRIQVIYFDSRRHRLLKILVIIMFYLTTCVDIFKFIEGLCASLKLLSDLLCAEIAEFFFRNRYTVNNSIVAFNCFTCKYGSFIYLTLSCGCCVEDRVLRN